MQIHTTAEFAEKRAAYDQAYAAFDRLAVEGREWDATSKEWAPECKAEDDAMEALLMHPAATPTEVKEKLAFMLDRNIDAGWSDHHPRYMAQIQRDLIELQRPCVSPSVKALFENWRQARLTFEAVAAAEPVDPIAETDLCLADAGAYIAMISAPCATPGDLIVKLYGEMLGEHGPTDFLFEVDQSDLTTACGSCDGAAQVAFVRDLLNCDLGRCLFMMGRVDFDAEDWIAATRRAHMRVHLVIQPDGARVLITSEPEDNLADYDHERFAACQALIAGGLGPIGYDRRVAIGAAIEVNHPEMLIDTRQALGLAA
ncbi:hypothetical protein H5J25_13745 [Sphingomonas aliaeris]|uniref:Uncharacterized protein n=1 Tax=Sphingomonas aliaeris TaxID=2759526 RepID=A0A974NTJ3_9SPHN|nr:hypothetical protein [Sphingomonas aliaeris]QQV76508.1 hypothetical protein H5J25_13745 [Sphingomonas aliaeris]